MRILHVIDHLGLGGAQSALADIVNVWPGTADRLHVVALGRATELAGRFVRRPNVTIEVLGGRKWDLSMLQAVRKKMQAGQFDVVHAHLTKSVAGVLWAGGNRHLACCVHLHMAPQHDPWVLTAAIRLWHARVDRFIACSQHIADLAGEFFPIERARIATVHNAFFSPAGSDACSPGVHRSSLGCRDDAFLVGFVGRLARQKGLADLLQAIVLASRSLPNLQLVVVGDGPLRRELQHKSDQLGIADRVHFVGYSADVASWIREFDVGVLPSHHEGLPLILLEMLGYGLPVIASQVGGIPECVIDGQTGVLVPPANPESLAGALTRLASDTNLRARLATAGQAHVQQAFAIEKQVHALRSLYTDVVNTRQLRPPSANSDVTENT